MNYVEDKWPAEGFHDRDPLNVVVERLRAENASLRARVAELEGWNLRSQQTDNCVLDAAGDDGHTTVFPAAVSQYVVQSVSVGVMDAHGVVSGHRTVYSAPDPRSEALSRAMRTPGA